MLLSALLLEFSKARIGFVTYVVVAPFNKACERSPDFMTERIDSATLRIIFYEAERGYRWIRTANESFGGRSALDTVISELKASSRRMGTVGTLGLVRWRAA